MVARLALANDAHNAKHAMQRHVVAVAFGIPALDELPWAWIRHHLITTAHLPS
jgi:hypothetical protein